jgi:transcriptional regulator with XRE-family HTH domain
MTPGEDRASMLNCIGDDVEPQAVFQPVELHEAIRAAYEGRVRQEDIAESIGVDQATVSRWARGRSIPNIVQMSKIEQLADRPAGWISIQAGLIADVRSVPEAIAVDPALDDAARASLLKAYLGATGHVAARRDAADHSEV